ncbi:X-Pro dipeptidyl-peptidase [Actinopolyspora xinjiangensis]|uniref:Xaa-Pro dipeptidyl-peptidase n=1 Tax=Actinopolyspora xinjiangensis TaxID=405564 RepID=A0A1H0TID5_9ACTN|nr:Xaa-Pro dipeptidyl-peptidase [Actinopolyspora xinjiangensis]SDP53793.1 X-Pro dipeptidyl-peptidase [Actinopolyspora xinjiangensis]
MWRARVAVVSALVVLPLSGAPAAAETTRSPEPVFEHGAAQPVFDASEAVREDLYVKSGVDSDGDGRDDRVHVQLVRPEETERGMRVPVVYRASPYFAGGNPVTNHDVNRELYVPDRVSGRAASTGSASGRAEAAEIGWAYQDFLLERGYAVVYAESLGSGASDGCPTSGGRNETLGAKSVIDWLNGRAPAHDSAGEPVVADWSTGKVAMMGVSYNGTLPNAVATTGVAGLETIVPIGAISSWYDYYRSDGAVVAPGGYQGEDTDVLAEYVHTNDSDCSAVIERLRREQDRLTGDYNEFWEERDYLDDVSGIEASVLAVHGLDDWNVKTRQVAQWYEALREHGVEHRIWWHQGGHLDPIGVRRDEWLRTLNRWFTHYLHGVNNGVRLEPRVTIQRADGSWHREWEWPAPAAREVSLSPTPGGAERGGLRLFGRGPAGAVETLRDDASRTVEELAKAARSPHRLAYFTREVPRRVRISGTVRARLALSFDRPAANVTAALVDRAPDGTITTVTRGWTDPQNRRSLERTTPVEPGQRYRIEVNMMPDDYVLRRGHQLGLIVLSSDHDYTLRPPAGGGLSLALSGTELRLPVVLGPGKRNGVFGRSAGHSAG